MNISKIVNRPSKTPKSPEGDLNALANFFCDRKPETVSALLCVNAECPTPNVQ